jgi:hypothetical protein
MTMSRRLMSFLMFALLAANLSIAFSQSANAAEAMQCSYPNTIHTNDFNTISPQEYFTLYRSG